ncbi:MAG: alpha/beta fold hydrolase [Pseudomonadota bacterium]
MKKILFFAIAAIGVLGFLVSCVGVPVGEARVFQPQPTPDKAQSAEEMAIEWEEIFERPSNFTFTNNINNDRSTIQLTKEDFIAAELRHGFWADGEIAVTEFVTDDPNRPLVLHCGGNASDRYSFGALFGLKVIPYADLIIFDYPGYGDSPGKPSAASFERMVDNLAAELKARRGKSERPLILWGYSLGGFVCAELIGAFPEADAIIIESSANDAKSAAPHLIPKILRPFLRVRLSPSLASYDNVEALKNYNGDVLVLAGAQDGILPARLSQNLTDGLEANGVAVTYFEFADGNHANLPTLDAYKNALRTFFSKFEESAPE